MSGLGNYILLGKYGGKWQLRSLFPQIMIPGKEGAGAQISKRKKRIFHKAWAGGGFRMDPGGVIWKVTWSESLNGCELGASDGVFLGNFQLDPGSEIWKGFWLGNFKWTLDW